MPLFGWSSEEVHYIAQRAYHLYREGRLREAAVLLRGLVVIDPHNAYCRRALAAVCVGLNEHQVAVRHLSAILAQDPNDTDALARRCETSIACGDLAAARLDYALLSARTAGLRLALRLRMQLRTATGIRESTPDDSQLLLGPPDNLYG